MNGNSPLQFIQRAVEAGDYRLSNHAEQEREADQITRAEIDEAFGSRQAELLEDYRDDSRGHSMLVLGLTNTGLPLHAVIGLSRRQVFFVTIYRPDPEKWYDWRRRV